MLHDFIESQPANQTSSALREALNAVEPVSRLLTWAGVAKLVGQSVFLQVYAALDSHPAGRAMLAVVNGRGEKGADWSDTDLRSGITSAQELGLLTSSQRDSLLSLGERRVWERLGLDSLPTVETLVREQAYVKARAAIRAQLTDLDAQYNAQATAAELLALAGLE